MGTKAAPPSAPATTGRKRKGRTFPPAAGRRRRRNPAPEVHEGGWASLPTDITLLVAGRVLDGDVVDYISFRAVCSGWRACTACPREPTMLDPRLRPRAWIALCDGDAVRPDEAGEIAFFHTRTARCIRVRLPELRRYRIVGFTDGLVILLHKRTTAVRVLHPFTRVAVDLPPLAPAFHRAVKHRNAMLEMNAAVCTAASGISIAVVACFPWVHVVLSAEPGHQGWEVIHKSMELLNTLPFQGRLYGIVSSYRQIVQVYPPNPLGPVVAHVPPRFAQRVHCSYLVESGGHILLVVRYEHGYWKHVEPWKRFTFATFKVSSVSRLWQFFPVCNLGDRALFLWQDRCLSISAKDLPSVRRNSLYFSFPLANHVILHCLTYRSFERPTTFCQVHDSKERIRPSVRPFTIADHLLTYCSHREWARGLMFHEYYQVPECFEDLWSKIRKQDSQLRIPQVRC
ncbi:hypothetical protein QOZ80_3BG0293070 [Eleusine coracana subsp. coracana]|nr:hypothetical protein QOZ80_3BG0293070 [Eleusine coracana subsp. coracana]